MRCTPLVRYLISYITDLEGDADYFNRFVEHSAVLERQADGRYQFKGAHDHFVFGGDSFDLGGGDLTLHAALQQLKRDYPDRVHLLLGNRDVNKMLFRTSLSASLEGLDPQEAHRRLFPVESPAQRKGLSYAQYLAHREEPLVTTLPSLLRWVLACRMAAPRLFEHRRAELAARSGRAVEDMDDTALTEHFLSSAQEEEGVVTAYLREGQLTALIGRALFVHGGVQAENIGYVPHPFSAVEAATSPVRLPGTVHDCARDWVNGLNDLKEKAFEEWWRYPHCAPCGTRTGGEYLRSYAFRYTDVPYSVMVNGFVDYKTRQLREVDAATVKYFSRNGIDVLCVGHQPAGDSPTVLQTEKGQFVVMADNSYCAEDNTRGKALTEVVIHQEADQPARPAVVQLHGLRADGAPFDFTLSPQSEVGRRRGEWWGKLPVSEGVVFQRTTDAFFHIEYKTVRGGECD